MSKALEWVGVGVKPMGVLCVLVTVNDTELTQRGVLTEAPSAIMR